MKTVAIIQARMASTRLYGKALAEAAGETLLWHMINRLKRCETLDEICVATTENPADEAIVAIADACDVRWMRGSEEDVLERVLEAALIQRADLIVELTADCPLIDPAIVDLTVREFMRWWDDPDLPSMDFVTTGVSSVPYPRGMDVRVFTTETLEEVDRLTNDPADREHVSLYIWEHAADFCVKYLHPPLEHLSDARLTVDTQEDLQLVRTIFERLYPVNPEFGLTEILELLTAQPNLKKINQHVQQKTVR